MGRESRPKESLKLGEHYSDLRARRPRDDRGRARAYFLIVAKLKMLLHRKVNAAIRR